MGKRRNNNFNRSALMNNASYIQYYNRLTEIALSVFEWKNLPSTIDERFLELTLFSDGQAVFFKDDVIGYLALQNASGGSFNVYRVPNRRRAYAVNGYQKELNNKDSVIIYNNYMRTGSALDIEIFSKRLYNIDRTIDVNINAQKTPILLMCDETERLSIENMYMQYEGNMPFIKGVSGLNPNSFTVLKTDAPFISPDLFELKTKIWNEALTYLGVPNVSENKKERLITDEVQRGQGGTIASRFSKLEARRQACKMINEMFDLDIWVDYRSLDDPLSTSDDDYNESEV